MPRSTFPCRRLVPVFGCWVWLALSLLVACGRLPAPEESGELVIGVRETPGLFEHRDGATTGADYDLVFDFARRLGLRPRFERASSPAELQLWLSQQRVHMAVVMTLGVTPANDHGRRPPAENGTPKPWLFHGNDTLLYSSPVRRVGQVVVGNSDDIAAPESLDELAGRTVQVLTGSPLAALLRALPSPPTVVDVGHLNESGLLLSIADRHQGLAAVEDINLQLALIEQPELRPLVRLPGESAQAWAFAGPPAAWLRERADAFLDLSRRDGSLARINDRYFGHVRRITAEEVTQFLGDVRHLLPVYRHLFQRAGERYGIDWRLLAALAYQESKWDPLATSPTKVRGMMMLTEETADRLGVRNRLDAGESIGAGARYLAALLEQVPPSTPHPDRLWLGLAAYNLGMGHLRGGLAVARGMKRNPDSWYDMKKVLPQLARPQIYARLKSGRARGGEAVIMVENIRIYHDILSRLETDSVAPLLQRPSVMLPASTEWSAFSAGSQEAFAAAEVGP